MLRNVGYQIPANPRELQLHSLLCKKFTSSMDIVGTLQTAVYFSDTHLFHIVEHIGLCCIYNTTFKNINDTGYNCSTR